MITLKEIFDDYKFWADFEKRKCREIKHLEESMTSISINNDGLPRGTAGFTMADYISAKETLLEDLEELRSKKWAAYDQIFILLVSMKSSKQIDVIYRRYICLDPWKKICHDIGYKKSYVMKLHDQAVKNLEEILKNRCTIPDHCSKV